jgi:hypothetical protein
VEVGLLAADIDPALTASGTAKLAACSIMPWVDKAGVNGKFPQNQRFVNYPNFFFGRCIKTAVS